MNPASVLVVDDGPALSEVVRLALIPEGYAVRIVTSADAPWTAMCSKPDVILLHVDSESIDSVLVSFLLRQDPATCTVPVVCIADDLARAIRTGVIADEWIAKPIEIRHIGQVVARCVRRHEARSIGALPAPDTTRAS